MNYSRIIQQYSFFFKLWFIQRSVHFNYKYTALNVDRTTVHVLLRTFIHAFQMSSTSAHELWIMQYEHIL